jgi:hypothetical protein
MVDVSTDEAAGKRAGNGGSTAEDDTSSDVKALLRRRPCNACRKAKAGCSTSLPCARCFHRCITCDRGPLLGLMEPPRLVYASTVFEVSE